MYKKLVLACGAGGSIKPGAQAPGSKSKLNLRAHEMGDSSSLTNSVARVRGLKFLLCFGSWGLRPRLYASACFAGLDANLTAARVRHRVCAHVTIVLCHLLNRCFNSTSIRRRVGPSQVPIEGDKGSWVKSPDGSRHCVPAMRSFQMMVTGR